MIDPQPGDVVTYVKSKGKLIRYINGKKAPEHG